VIFFVCEPDAIVIVAIALRGGPHKNSEAEPRPSSIPLRFGCAGALDGWTMLISEDFVVQLAA